MKATKVRKVNKAEIVVEEQSKEDPQVCAVTPRPKSKGPKRAHLQPVLPKLILSHLNQEKGAREEEKVRGVDLSQDLRNGSRSAYRFTEESVRKGDHCNYAHQVDSNGKPVPVGPEILQRYDDAVKRFNESKAQAKAKSAPKGGFGFSAENEGVKVAAHAVKVPERSGSLRYEVQGEVSRESNSEGIDFLGAGSPEMQKELSGVISDGETT